MARIDIKNHCANISSIVVAIDKKRSAYKAGNKTSRGAKVFVQNNFVQDDALVCLWRPQKGLFYLKINNFKNLRF